MVVFLSFFLISILPLSAYGSQKIFQNSQGMKFILIPAGTFIMGSPAEESHRQKDEIQHRVTISKPYYLQIPE